jgi:hypothetical protein
VAQGDFNGDGTLDLALDRHSSSLITVLLGRGTGRFDAGARFDGIYTPVPVAADVNRDGKLDLVEASGFDGLGVQLGEGDGTFAAPVLSSTIPAFFPAVADIDGDGFLDAVTAFVVDPVADTFQLAVSYGNGTATFAPPTPYGPAVGDLDFRGLAVGDVDGDGLPDVVTAGDENIRVYRNTGGRTFGGPGLYQAGTAMSYPQVGDITGDGVADIVVTNDDTSATVQVLPGTGDGAFGAAVVIGPFTGFTDEMTLGDLNADRVLDVVVVLLGAPNTLAVVHASSGQFVTEYFSGFGGFRGALVVDRVNDGKRPDVAVVGSVFCSGLNVRMGKTMR